MARLTEEMVIARSRQSDLGSIKKLNCWGSDLSDVSIIRRMRGVEVLALSVNKITSLADFEDCRNLQELYLRKNNIQDINEIAYLQALPKLKYLWLEENPCCDSAGPHYRSIVLRALPNLKKLDNKDVTPEEIQEAMRGGPTQREEEIYEDAQPQQQQPSPPQQQQQQQQQQEYYQQQQQQQQQQRRSQSPVKEEYYQSDYQRSAHPAHYRHSQTDLTEWDEQHQYNGHNQQRRSAGEDRYAYRNGNCPREREEWEDGDRPRNRRNEGRFSDTASVVSNAVLNHYAGYHRRPVNRNSNLLSATLCLVKELDYPSLEVVEHAVRCRIDELSAE
ncbi:cilia- and flagella-associated protein 410 isoform X5 [Hermetia illucens]|uniref:cilia- and flagella-associated protein 410 isoform X5 n=1 Tax=Hermetia illucens TaxID=343691 RepID=UPI0018CC1894|nr:cilia- and flagella-associated protein 410 isoform X5 [Hermetia illucens]